MAPETFYPFYSLPLELRLKIWSLALPPRIIHIKFRLNAYRPNRTLLPSPTPYNPKDPPPEAVPVLFHVFQQSRIEGQTLGYHIPASSVYRTPPAQVLSLSLDTIYCPDILLDMKIYEEVRTKDFHLEHSPLWRLALDADFASSVTSLALPANGLKVLQKHGAFQACNNLIKEMVPALKQFRVLRELMLVLDSKVHNNIVGPRNTAWRQDDEGAKEKFVPMRLCDKEKYCPVCCRFMPGLVRTGDVTWRVKCGEGDRGGWRGPKVKFVCSRKLVAGDDDDP